MESRSNDMNRAIGNMIVTSIGEPSEIMLRLQTQRRLMACTEILGEREERILELIADISDMKALYREQIEFVLGELAHSCSPSGAASSVSSWNPGPEN